MQMRHRILQKALYGMLIVLCLGALALRVPGVLTPIWNLDEAVSACAANAILDGGIPYRDAVDHRGPVTYYAYAAVFALFGANNMIAVHVGLLALVAFVGWLLYRCGTLMADRVTGLLAALAFFLLSVGLFGANDLAAAHTEYAVILFSTIGVYGFLSAQRAGASRRWPLLLCGVCYGLAFFSKQPGLFDFAAVFLWLAVVTWFRKLTGRQGAAQAAVLAAGFAVSVLGVAGYFALRGGFDDFVFYFWTYNTRYYVNDAGIAERLRIALNFFRYAFTYFPLFALAFWAGLAWSARRFWRTRRLAMVHQHDAQLFVAIWTAMALSVPSISGRIPAFGHYFIQFLPPFSLLIGFALRNMAGVVLRGWAGTWNWPRRQRIQRLISVGGIVGLAALTAALAPVVYPRFRASFPGGARNWIEEAAVDYIRRHARPDESIFVWGFYPELYVLADRPPASRYVYANVLTGFIPWEHMEPEYDTSATIVPGTWDILMAELRDSRPALIIDTSPGRFRGYGKYPPQKFPLLRAMLAQQYAVAHEITTPTNLIALRIYQRRSAEE